MSIHSEISQFLDSYFEALYTQDLALLDKVFLDESVLFSQTDNETIVRPFSLYRDIVENRASPESMAQPRDEEVTMIDILSDNMALARVRLRLFDSIMLDHLCLLKTATGWKIAAKTFTRYGPA
ncbi:nuclear transport factor 2 family protein [Vibrio sp. V23_P3S9T160]|uniref:nuclear transport factor 2 family protein n=1 Tax=Vibrio sp. V23_P3S9T160 TaxID=1938675 RepID=UPI001373077D|nr:nuclear transport factor 2 family protein [Vibrio sp. V23_P3S9T160]NAW97901.1 hypothetical protein [Vibrio sp. V23_P3S9T160]